MTETGSVPTPNLRIIVQAAPDKIIADSPDIRNNHFVNELSIQVPNSVAAVFAERGDDPARAILIAAVIKWYELGKISQGKSAEMLGISRSAFLDLLAAYRVSAWQYTEQEFDEELALE